MGGLFLRNLIPIFFACPPSSKREGCLGGDIGNPPGTYHLVDWEKAETSSLALGVQMTDDQNTSARLRRKDISGSSLVRG